MKPVSALPFLQNAFRPFFLFGTAFAATSIVAWAGMLGQQWLLATGLPPLPWHGHEMLFGFGAALVVGFVLTASQEWTGIRPLPPVALAGLAALWVLARIVFLLPQHVPYVLAALLDSLLLLLAALNIAMHLAVAGVVALDPAQPLMLAIWLLGALMVMMGGRVIPFFTARRLGVAMPSPERLWPACELAAVATALAVTLAPRTLSASGLALVASVTVFARWLAWRPWISRSEPMLWILHLGYLWLAVSYGLAAWVHATGAAPLTLPVHALTTGALGTLGLGMMARVALGHTGRPITADAAIVTAFVLVLAAGVFRLTAYAPGPLGGIRGLMLAGACWSFAFGLYVVRYLPVMFGRRAGT